MACGRVSATTLAIAAPSGARALVFAALAAAVFLAAGAAAVDFFTGAGDFFVVAFAGAFEVPVAGFFAVLVAGFFAAADPAFFTAGFFGAAFALRADDADLERDEVGRRTERREEGAARFQPTALSERKDAGIARTPSGPSTTASTAASARSARTSEITVAGRRAFAA